MTTADIVVIGGGCTGASTAFQLVRHGAGRVVLVERKTAGSGPTAKSSGIIRLHYSYEPLVRLAARSRDMFSHFEEITGATADFKRTGFLLLASHAHLPALKANVALQRSLGLQTCALSPEDVWLLDRRLELADVGGAAFEPDSGYADGYATVAGFVAAGRRETVLAGVLAHDREETVDPDEFNHGVDFDFVESLGRVWARRFPGAAEATVHGGFASLYDVTPDWQPILGPVDGMEGLFVAAGFSGHGFKLSPALGEGLAAMLIGERLAIDLSAFRLSRFGNGELIRSRHAQAILG